MQLYFLVTVDVVVAANISVTVPVGVDVTKIVLMYLINILDMCQKYVSKRILNVYSKYFCCEVLPCFFVLSGEFSIFCCATIEWLMQFKLPSSQFYLPLSKKK